MPLLKTKQKLYEPVGKKSAKLNNENINMSSIFSYTTWRNLRAKFAETHANVTAGMAVEQLTYDHSLRIFPVHLFFQITPG